MTVIGDSLRCYFWFRFTSIQSTTGYICASLLFPFVAIALCHAAYAQTVSLNDAVSRPIPGAGHDYIKGLSETVSPSNGSLAVSIALPAPAGRGISFPLSITYNSGEVHRFTSAYTGYGVLDFTGTTAYMVADRAQQGNGWSDTLPYVSFEASTVPQPGGAYYDTLGWCPVTDSYVFYDQGGGSHQLGIAALGVAANNSTQSIATPQGCTTVPLGTNYYYGYVQNGGDDEVGASMEFACDGNYYGQVYPQDCQYAEPSFTVTDLHGTVFSFPVNSSLGPTGSCCNQTFPAEPKIVFPTQIEDRNGNIERSSIPAVGSTGYVVTFTDTAGRTVTAQSNQGVMTSYSIGGLTFNLTSGSTGANFSAPYTQLHILQDANATCQAAFTVNDAPYNVVSSISLPNGQSYGFLYDGTYGLLKEIDYPNGGWVKYQWGFPSTYNALANFDAHDGTSAVSGGCAYQYSTPVILQRTVGYSKGSAAAQTQTFSYVTNWDSTHVAQWDTKQTTVVTTDNVTNQSATTTYKYVWVGTPTQVNAEGHVPNQIPVEAQITYSDWGSSSTLLTVNKVWTDQYQMVSQQSIWNNGQITWMAYCYNGSGQPGDDLVVETDEYDFGASPTLSPQVGPYTGQYPACGQSSATRRTTYDYTISGQPCQVISYGSGGSRVAEVDAYLDGGSSPCASASASTQAVSVAANTHDENKYGPTVNVVRGNPTEVVRWLNTGGSVISKASYDETGQLISSTDPCGVATCGDMTGANHTTTYTYTDAPSGGNSAGASNAYVTQINDPLGHSQQFTYSYSNGELTSSTDENGQLTSFQYNDALNRLTDTYGPPSVQNGNTRPHTNEAYVDGTSPSITITNPIGVQFETLYDGLGHVTRTKMLTDPAGVDFVDRAYDGEGRVQSVSNPYRTASDPSYGFTSYLYDGLGRKTTQCQPGNSASPSNTCVPQNSYQSWTYSGSSLVTFRDEDGHQWQRTSDGLGRLTQVIEPTGAATNYTYDALNNLLTVNQVGLSGETARNRTFAYDSLSRLLASSNPETASSTVPPSLSCAGTTGANWTTCFGYDANGNLASKTDNRSITTSYSYDAANRLLSKTYSNDPACTPWSYYQYDSSASQNSTGRLTSTWTQHASGGACSTTGAFLPKRVILAYDEMGRLASEEQYTPASEAGGKVYAPAYKYDLAGNLVTSTDGTTPSPTTTGAMLTFTNAYDGAGHLDCLTSNFVDAVHPSPLFAVPNSALTGPCANSVTGLYTAFGALAQAVYGSSLTLSRIYDVRLRPTGETDIGANSVATGGTTTVTITGSEQSKQ